MHENYQYTHKLRQIEIKPDLAAFYDTASGNWPGISYSFQAYRAVVT